MNILVVSRTNAARSILLEALINDLGWGRLYAFSGGSHPAEDVHPEIIRLMEAEDLDTQAAEPKTWDRFTADDAPFMDLVITLSGVNPNVPPTPKWPGDPIEAKWVMEDPLSAEDVTAACAKTLDSLKRRANALLDLPIENMDKVELTATLKRVGKMG